MCFPASASMSIIIFLTISFTCQKTFHPSNSIIIATSFITKFPLTRQNVISPSINPPQYLPASFLQQISLCLLHLLIQNYKLFKGRQGYLAMLVFLGCQAQCLPQRGYWINSYIRFAYANTQHHKERDCWPNKASNIKYPFLITYSGNTDEYFFSNPSIHRAKS